MLICPAMDADGWFQSGGGWFSENSYGSSSTKLYAPSCTEPTTWIPNYDGHPEERLIIPHQDSNVEDMRINDYSSFELEAAAAAAAGLSTNDDSATWQWQYSPEIGNEMNSTTTVGGAASAAAGDQEEDEGRGLTSCGYSCQSKSHSQAEKRRRDRINAQLASLRKLIPKSEKMDKASLLRNTVDRVKQLRIQASEIDETVPSELDQLKVEDLQHNELMIKATLCCEDRPELLTDLERALKGLKLMVVRANISSLSDRLKIILILSSTSGDVIGVSIKQSLRTSLHRLVCFSNTMPSSSYRLTSRRQRLLFPS